LTYLNKKWNSNKKIFADGTTTLFGKEFRYTTETKTSNVLLGRKCLKM
jgi:hypothetical protein